MQCSKIKKWLLKDPSQLTAEEKDLTEAHLASCEDCRRIREKLGRLFSVLDGMLTESVPEPVSREIWPLVRSGLSASRAPVRRRPFPVLRLAGSFAAVAAVSLFVWNLWIRDDSKLPGAAVDGRFEHDVVIESAEIDGKMAVVSVFESNEPGMTFIWLE